MSLLNPLSLASPYIRIAHDFMTKVNFQIGPVRIVDHALHYFKEGEGIYIVDSIEFPIQPGSLFLIRPNVTFSFSPITGTRFHMYNLHFDLIEQEDSHTILSPYPKQTDPVRIPLPYCLSEEAVQGLPSSFPLVEVTSYERLFFRVLNCYGQRRQQNTSALLQSKASFLELLAFLWNQAELQTSSANSIGTIEVSLDNAVSFIQAHLYEPITLEDVAAAAQMSKSYLVKCFRNMYHLSPMKFLNRQRIEHAKCELLYTNKPIKAIAKESGFESIHSFYHAFQREVGTPPRTYRTLTSPAPNEYK